MKLCVIAKDDEPIYDEKLLRRNGYTDIERCPVVPSDGNLTSDPILTKFIPYRRLSDAERSLALSWSNMLLTHLDDPDDTMFCEADVSPRLTAHAMSGLLDSMSKKHDVFRPFLYLAPYDVKPPAAGLIDVMPFKSLPFKTEEEASRMLSSSFNPDVDKWKYIYGTHVLFVAKHARRKLAAAFRRCILPCDLALYIMSKTDRINMVTALANLFVQVEHESSCKK